MSSIYLRLIAATLLWGGTFVAGRLLARELDPMSAAFLRFTIAGLFLYLLLKRKEPQRGSSMSYRQWIGVSLLGLTGVFSYNLFFFSGLQSVEAGRAALIIAINPVFIMLFSYLFFSERLSALRLLGLLLSVLGGMTVISHGHLSLLLKGEIGQGELYLLGCVFSWVAYTLVGKRIMAGLSPLAAVTYSAILGAMMLLPLALWQGVFTTLMQLTPVAWGALLYLALFGTVLGFVWFYEGVRAIGPGRAGQFINLVPVSGVGLGILFLGESFSITLFIGGAMVLTGLWLTNRPG